MKSTGLASPTTKKENNILTATRKAFGKLDRKQIPLEDRLQKLSEQDLHLVLQTAQFVKMAHGFGERSTQPYIQVVREMYPKVSFNLQNMIAEVLQDADSVEAKPIDKSIERDATINKTLDDYAAALGKATNDIATDDEKAQQLEAAILNKLKVS
jgi:hypothetical protein